jgi:hypothetical protein
LSNILRSGSSSTSPSTFISRDVPTPARSITWETSACWGEDRDGREAYTFSSAAVWQERGVRKTNLQALPFDELNAALEKFSCLPQHRRARIVPVLTMRHDVNSLQVLFQE